ALYEHKFTVGEATLAADEASQERVEDVLLEPDGRA
ncbi:MAG: hypothetical protein QOC87_642, partial [Actinomycetota bacterium]|nr:hypothetical protein [Actinomycetota bacterium]